MNLLTFKQEGMLKVGVKTENGILDLEKAAQLTYSENLESIETIVSQGDEALSKINQIITEIQTTNANSEDVYIQEQNIKYGPCVPNPGKIICVGLNYKEHAEESNMDLPSEPLLFGKFANAIAAHEDEIEIPADAEKIDYEAELVLVIGKQAKQVAKEDALDYVFGYCNSNEVSARDLQMRTSQWLLGKSLDGFNPVGPYLVTADEVGNPHELDICLKVNGEIRQKSNTKYMIFPCDELISYISQYITLEPGDIILTGTPDGVILGYPPEQQVWLQSGDEMTVEIEKLGKLTNTIK